MEWYSYRKIFISDGRELFNTALKFLKYSKLDNMWCVKIIKANIFLICKALLNFMKRLSHENLKPYNSYTVYKWLEYNNLCLDSLSNHCS